MLECTIDYETRSKAPLSGPASIGSIGYAEHESTSILCVGLKINDGPVRIWIPERAPMPDDLWECFKHGKMIAHNAQFERAITKYVLSRYETLTPEQREFLFNHAGEPHRWKCTAAKAAASSLPRKLEEACRVMELETQKDLRGHKLILKYCKPRKPSKNNPKEWWDNKAELRAIYRYCITDVKAEYELDHAIPDLTPSEQEVWELDQKINDRGVLIDIETVRLIIAMIREEKDFITKKVQELSNGEIEKPTQTAKLLLWLNTHGANMLNVQAATMRDKLETKIPSKVREMLEHRQAASKTSLSKYNAMLRLVGSDNRVKELLLYCGADRSGRWSGKRLQPQNFPRPTPYLQKMGFNSDEAIELIKTGDLSAIRKKYGPTKVMDVFASCIRGMIIPSPGYEFFDADFSAVEARLAFWFAEHEEGLKAYRDGRKLYEEMASEAFNIPVEQIGKDSLERFVGKESILGCQYGMGAPKFLSQCHKKDMKQVTLEIAKKAVYAYRKRHYPVVLAWNAIEHAVVKAIQHPGKIFKTNRVFIYVRNNFLIIKLPSGRKLRYFKPRVVQKQIYGKMKPKIRFWGKGWTVNAETGKPKREWCELTGWGGIFFNHIVQGTARDFMVHGIKRIENASYRFLVSIHDEGLSERKIGCGTLSEYIQLMAGDLPIWGKSAPITAEGWVGSRYRK